jgi:hypothetical protein
VVSSSRNASTWSGPSVVRSWWISVDAGEQSEFAEAGLSQDSPESEVLDAVVAKPILMERPIVVRGDRAAIGRPPEDVLALLEDEPEPGA